MKPTFGPPKRVPPGAVRRRIRHDGPLGFDYFLGGRKVARAYFHETGAIDWEMHFDEAGRMHGLERHEFETGGTKYEARWVRGLQHGLQQQWDESGRLLGRRSGIRPNKVDRLRRRSTESSVA